MTESIVEKANPIALVSRHGADARTGAFHPPQPADQLFTVAELGRERTRGTDSQHRLRPAGTDRGGRPRPGRGLRPSRLAAAGTGAAAGRTVAGRVGRSGRKADFRPPPAATRLRGRRRSCGSAAGPRQRRSSPPQFRPGVSRPRRRERRQRRSPIATIDRPRARRGRGRGRNRRRRRSVQSTCAGRRRAGPASRFRGRLPASRLPCSRLPGERLICRAEVGSRPGPRISLCTGPFQVGRGGGPPESPRQGSRFGPGWAEGRTPSGAEAGRPTAAGFAGAGRAARRSRVGSSGWRRLGERSREVAGGDPPPGEGRGAT